MRRVFIFICLLIPVLTMAQGNKGNVDECAPIKNGKICYTDEVEVENSTKGEIFKSIDTWAKKTYNKDLFLSNIHSNKSKGTIFINSKVELLLNDTDKTIVKYKINITCFDNYYTVEATDIIYQYDPENNKKHKIYEAEKVISNNGKSNTIAIIKDPKLFCDATFFFIENLFADIYSATND